MACMEKYTDLQVERTQDGMNEFMQQGDLEEDCNLETDNSPDLPEHFSTTIDPPIDQPIMQRSNDPTMQWIHNVFESGGEDLLLGNFDDLDTRSADEDYELDSPSSSSSDDELPDLQLQKISGLSEFKDPSSKVIPEAPRKAASSYRDILNEIFDEEIEIPERNNLGPKPWLMKPRNPRNTPLGRKTRNILNEESLLKVVEPEETEKITSQIDPPIVNSQDTERIVEEKNKLANKIEREDEDPAFHTEYPSRGRASSGSSGNAISDNERPNSAKYPSEADTGFGSNTSSNPSPSNSSNNISRLPSRERLSSSDIKKQEDIANDKKKAQELAQAALQALSLSKNLLKDMQKNEGSSTALDPECIYDEVPASPVKTSADIHEDSSMQQNLYDDVPTEKAGSKRTIISVPKYIPPDIPVRNNPNPVTPSQPIYDITRSNTQAPQNISSDAMALMYKLFGREQQKEQVDNRLYSRPYSRPSSVKSVTFEDDVRSQYTDDESRPPSRNGSIYSEWSECTINIPDYPEHDSSNAPTCQVEFPRFPQVGYPSNPPQHPQPPNTSMPSLYNHNFSVPNSANFAPNFPPPQSNPNFHSQNEPWRNLSPYARFPGQNQQLTNPYDIRNPVPIYPPNYNTSAGPNMPNFPSNAPYPHQPMESHMPFQNRPLSHAQPPPPNQWAGFSPPRHFGAFSPPRNFRGPPRHYMERDSRGTNRGYGRNMNGSRGGRSQSRSKSRTRRFSYESDYESRSPSNSPVRRRDGVDTDIIAGRSFIDGYKAALKDAVLTFAEQQKKKRSSQFLTEEKDICQSLRRTLSAGRIRELPDNIELGDLRKALAIPNKSYSDDEYDMFDRDDEDFVVPSAGRPSSKRGSIRKQQQGWRPLRNDNGIARRPQERMGVPTDSDDDSDYSEYDEDVMLQQQRRYHDGYRDEERGASSKNRVLKQRYIDSFQKTSSNVRAPVRPNNEYDDRDFTDIRDRRSEARRRVNYEDVTIPEHYDSYNPRNEGNNQQRSRMMDDFRGQPPQQRGRRNKNYQHQEGRDKRRGAEMEIITTMAEKFPVMSSEDEDDLNEVIMKRRKAKIMPVIDDDGSDNEEGNNPAQTTEEESRKKNTNEKDSQINEDENLSENNSDSEDKPIRMFRSQNQTITNDNDDSAECENSSSDSDDDDSPPIRIFRSQNSNDVGEGRGIQSDLYDDERDDDDDIMPDPSEIAEPRPLKPREAKRTSMMELQSETQRLIRESVVNLPYHRPESKRLSDFMKRPTIKRKEEERKEEKKQDEADIDDLPTFNTNDKFDADQTEDNSQSVVRKLPVPVIVDSDNETVKAEEVITQEKERPLTYKERLLKRLGKNLPKLSQKISSEDCPKFINLDEDSTPSKASGVNSLMERFLKHSKSRKSIVTPEKVEISIVRKEEREDGSGVELVSDIVKATVTDDNRDMDEFEDVEDCNVLSLPGQRLQLLRQRLAIKMKKRREIERKKREEIYKLDNEEIEEEPDEEECDWSDDSEEDEQDEQDEPIAAEKKSDVLCNGLIDDSDDDTDLETQPMEKDEKPKDSLSPHVSVVTSCDSSLPRMVSDGSVLLFDDSTRSSASTFNKSNAMDGRITPALDRTCSDDSFYGSLIPLRQPEISNISSCSNFARNSKKGEFDDTDFELNSRSQPFHFEFEASQSQLLDADGFIKDSRSTKKRDAPILPPGAEDDNATDCNMTQLLNLCTAPFNSSESQESKGLSCLMADTTGSTTQDLIGLCSGNFDDSEMQSHLKDNETISSVTKESDDSAKEKTVESCDITTENENSSDLFGTQEFKDQSFGFMILPSNSQKPPERIEFSDESEDDEPMTIIRSKKLNQRKRAQQFVENEAELSGSEVGSDDEDEDEADEYEVEEPIEELPHEDEIQRQVNRVHMRQVLEEDQRDIELLQEAFMGGEEIGQRERKFRWKNADSEQHLFNSDGEESNHGDNEDNRGIEDSQWRKERLQREEFLRNKENQADISEDSQLLKFGRQIVMNRQNSNTASSVQEVIQVENQSRKGRLSVDETSNSRDSFKPKGRKGSFLTRSKIVLDKLASLQELKNVNGPKHTDKMLFKTVSPKAEKRKRPITNQQTKGPSNKRRKKIIVDEDSNSVFDLL